jgi:sugar lactone lactonase YvrE
MRQAWRVVAALVAIGVIGAGGSVALADNGNHGGRDNNGNRGGVAATTVFTMPAAPDGNPEGIAVDKRSGRFFVSRVGTGSIFQGTLGTPALTPFITAAGITGTPPLATGLKVRRGLLYVAGASTGQIRVYDLANPAAAPKVFETGGGFINDLDLDSRGNVFATDSTQSKIFEVTAAQVAAGTPATALPIDVSSGITSDTTPGVFNLNGIVVKHHDELIVVQSNTGQLFRITFRGDDNDDNDHHARAAQAAPTAKVQAIDLGGKDVKNGDGLLVDRGRLLVVRGSNVTDPATPGADPRGAKGLIDVVKLSRHDTRGRVGTPVFDASFSGPSTIARLGNRLLVVNASFAAGPTNGNFTVSGIARNAVRHSGGGGGHGH